ncbi:MAG: hypothetical protein IPI49_20845 [Myxococcales bacterium]|nr:hypothetical protein [Myxococcales bacterium]
MGDFDAVRCAAERDFYRRLLDLGGQNEIERLLDQALKPITEVTGATLSILSCTRAIR